MLALHLGGRSEPLENAQASERQKQRGGCAWLFTKSLKRRACSQVNHLIFMIILMFFFSQNVWKNMLKLDVLFLDYFCKFFFFIFKAREWLYFILSYEVKSLFLNFLNFFSNKGYRFMVFNNNTSQPSQTSFFESPLYERSYEGHNICVRFRYLVYGPGRHFLRIYQQLNLTDYPRRTAGVGSERVKQHWSDMEIRKSRTSECYKIQGNEKQVTT